MITATCHCGNVRIDILRKPGSVTECNCSICRRYGARWAYYTRKLVQISSGPDSTTAYVWGDRMIEFYHCNICGCVTHYESVNKTDDSRVAVNARMMSADIVSCVPVKKFDGADTWKYIEE